MSDELKPCAHCGGGHVVEEWRSQDGWSRWRVECGRCGMSTDWHGSRESAIAAWNTRADDAQKQPVDNAQADSRKKIEVDALKLAQVIWQRGFDWGANNTDNLKTQEWSMADIVELLDRQAAITEREMEDVFLDRAEVVITRREIKQRELQEQIDELTAERDELRDKLTEKQHVCDVQRDSFLKLERENRELQDVCGELERTIENMRGRE